MDFTLILFVAASASVPTERYGPQQIWPLWEECYQQNAREFAVGPDSASLVASAAVQQCFELLDAFLDSDDDPHADAQKRAELLTIRQAMRRIYARRAYDESLAIVVETRSHNVSNR